MIPFYLMNAGISIIFVVLSILYRSGIDKIFELWIKMKYINSILRRIKYA